MSRLWKQKIKFISLSVLLLLFLLPYGYVSAEAPQQITMSIEQFNQLKQQTQLLDTKLKLALTLLTEPQKQALLQATQLATAKEQIQLSQKELQVAKTSLTSALELTNKHNSSLKLLSEQIKKERQVQRREKIQHTFWGIVGGLAVGYVAHSV